MTNKIYALVGPHACGKVSIVKELMAVGVNYIPLYTTRPAGKIDSDPDIYKFVSREEFFKHDFLVKTTYKGEYYGVLKKDLLSSLKFYPLSVLIGDVAIVKQLKKLLSNNFESIYVMCDYVSMIERMLKLGHTNVDIKLHLSYAENNGEFDNWKHTTHIVKNIAGIDKATLQVMTLLGLTELMPPEKLEARLKPISVA